MRYYSIEERKDAARGTVMKKTLLGIAAVAALIATPAPAADMPLKAPPPAPAPECVWCGWYIGVNGGGGWGNTTWTYPTDNFYTTAAGQGFGTNPNGGLFGGHIGYNGQFGQTGQWVGGVEFTGDWANLQQTLLGPVTPTYPLDSYKTQLNDLETLTVRFGYAPGNWFWYGKAGIATGSVALNVISGAPVAGVAFSNTTRTWGPTAGVGLEYMLAPHFIIGVEYDYAALPSESITATAVCTVATTCGTLTTPVTINSGTFGIQTLVGRVSYKF